MGNKSRYAINEDMNMDPESWKNIFFGKVITLSSMAFIRGIASNHLVK